MTQYPECEKMLKVREESQKLGEFLIWLKGRYTICNFEGHIPPHAVYSPAIVDVEKELAAYFDIDLMAMDREKRQMLNELRV